MNKIIQIASSRRTWAWPYVAFLAMFVVLPLILVGVYAFTDIEGHFTLRNFAKFFSHSEAIQTFLYSLMIAVFNTAICLLIGYPAAYIMAQEDFKTPKVMAMLFILPMWINFLLRTVATVELFNAVQYVRFAFGRRSTAVRFVLRLPAVHDLPYL